MGTCKHCGHELYTTMGGKCRTCGRKAGFFRSMTGTPTLTQRGAVKEIQRKIDKIERNRDQDIAELYRMPVTDGLHGMTWQAAEQLACEWMKKNGHWRAKVSPPGADGGIDVESMISIAQVKHHASPVGIAEIQRIYGIAQSTRKKALFFAASGYTPKALAWAKKHKVECYTYPPMKRVKG